MVHYRMFLIASSGAGKKSQCGPLPSIARRHNHQSLLGLIGAGVGVVAGRGLLSSVLDSHCGLDLVAPQRANFQLNFQVATATDGDGR